MRTLILATAVMLLPMSMVGSTPQAELAATNPTVLSAQFNVEARTNIPGKTLKAGAYSITIIDHLSDRLILRVANSKGQTQTTFLGVYSPSLSGSNASGPISWPQSRKDDNALRGFVFPPSRAVEFVYPKTEAVTIAKANFATVLAIDPESDNLHLKHNELTPDDLQIVTLWALNPTRVGPNDQPAIAAARYQTPQSSNPILDAAATQAPGRPASRLAQTQARSAGTQVASNAHRPVIGALPHTANDIGTPLLLSLLAFTAAGFFYFRRLSANAG